MNKTKKTLFSLLAVCALVISTVIGTIAYLTDRSTVTNTFTVGNVDIKLEETLVNKEGKPVDQQGNLIPEGQQAVRFEGNVDGTVGNNYHLIPGQTYTKDPIMTVLKGSEESYVRMLVTINNHADLKEIFGNDFLPQNYVEGWNNEVWVPVKTTVNTDDTVTYEFRYFETVDGFNENNEKVNVELDALFDTFTLPGEVTGEELAKIADLTIKVEGHAIQVATFKADAEHNKTAEDVAWEAFDRQYAQNAQ